MRFAAFVPAMLAAAASAAGLPPPVTDADFRDDGAPATAVTELGRLLFFDPLLSGNRNIACATCHHPAKATGDGLALSIGEGAAGLGPRRDTGPRDRLVPERVGRNATPLFNIGAREYVRMFHDGRVETQPEQPGTFLTPAGAELPPGLDNVVAAQAMFPVVSPVEMAGQEGENPVADAVALPDLTRAWELLAERLRDPANGYVDHFIAAFDDVREAADITFVHAANALAAFQAVAWRSDHSPFDRYLAGDQDALTPAQNRGLALFYGRAGCSRCHSGPFLTDHAFHAAGMPQVGPGKDNGFDGHDDFGRENITGDPADRYRFRTPALRNVALTGPWGHAGSFDSLEALLRHHLDPGAGLAHWQTREIAPRRADLAATDQLVMDDPARRAVLAACSEIPALALDEPAIADLLAFLGALTDPALPTAAELVPERVPSGLPVDR